MGLTVRPTGLPGTTGSPIREAVLSVSRAIEDLNWTNLSVDDRTDSAFLTHEERRESIKRARQFARRNPLAKQASSLLINYVLGRGVSLAANNKSLVGRLVDEFWSDPTNRTVLTSLSAMSDFLQGAFTDGAQFLLLFPDTEDGTLQLGWLDPLFVVDVIMDPENAKVPKWYKVARASGKYDFTATGAYTPHQADEVLWYRHWRNKDKTDPKGKTAPKKVEDGLVYQAKRGKGKFGQSEILAAMDWLNAHKNFMEDRATLTRAAASIAWKKKRRNSTASDVQAEVARLTSSLANTMNLGYENNPPNSAGGTVVENEASNLEWMKTDTGGANALADERILRMMAGSGMGGVPNHYFGDEANANLATATSMELPLLKAYENWQQWLTDVIKDLLEFMLETAHEAGRIGDRDDASRYTDRSLTAERVLGTPQAVPVEEPTPIREAPEGPPQKGPPQIPPPVPTLPVKDVTFSVPQKEPSKTDKIDWYVDVDFPPIVVKDIKPYFESLKILMEMIPGGPDSTKLVVSLALTALGINDVDQVLTHLFPPLPPGAKPTPMLTAGQAGQQMGLPPGGMKLLGPGAGPPQAVREASPWRVHRFLTSVQTALEEAS